MTETAEKKKKPPAAKPTSFKCRGCEKSHPLDEMMVVTRFFPPMTVCRACEKKMR